MKLNTRSSQVPSPAPTTNFDASSSVPGRGVSTKPATLAWNSIGAEPPQSDTSTRSPLAKLNVPSLLVESTTKLAA
ncbi:hypothetical protein ACFJIW_19625 [Tahibacter sp. UC22_41]|uniref:hypothetical protein n=1 Tax=Tahibacter sp. UC22_41 TaxID=3350178 RepID=UPI0036DA6464